MFSHEMGIGRKKSNQGVGFGVPGLIVKVVMETDSSSVLGCLDSPSPISKLFKNISSKFYHKTIHVANMPFVIHGRIK